MNKPKMEVTVKGRYLGITLLVIIQIIFGITHIFFGLAMLSGKFSIAAYSFTPIVYSFYTLIYGCLAFFFACFVWMGKRLGWMGTIGVSLFVIIADILAAFDLVNVLGIPKIAAFGEVPFCILLLAYLLQHNIRSKFIH